MSNLEWLLIALAVLCALIAIGLIAVAGILYEHRHRIRQLEDMAHVHPEPVLVEPQRPVIELRSTGRRPLSEQQIAQIKAAFERERGQQ